MGELKPATKAGLFSRVKQHKYPVLVPKKSVEACSGKDIKKKGSQRKSKYLFSFPGLIAPLEGGKIGTLDKLDSEKPVLYIEFPTGRMKCIGTILFPKNPYLTLQCPTSGKNVTCEDVFTTVIAFSECFWIGTAENNPTENPLKIPSEIQQQQPNSSKGDLNFSFGAGTEFQNLEKSLESESEEDQEQESEEQEVKKTTRKTPRRVGRSAPNHSQDVLDLVSSEEEKASSEEEFITPRTRKRRCKEFTVVDSESEESGDKSSEEEFTID